MRLVLVVGSTRTAEIDGISAAGTNPDALFETPAADAEIVAYGQPISSLPVPTSPTGCPTPALITRAVRDLVKFDLLVLDAGLAVETAAPTVSVDSTPGADIREPEPVPNAIQIYESAREVAAGLPDEELMVGESIPGGTTTAMGVMRALGKPFGVSSSLPENPLGLKRQVVAEGLEASRLEPGDAADDPSRALRLMGDPVLAAVTGVIAGTAERGGTVTLAGGTQLITAAALARHAGLDQEFTLATTQFVAEDEAVDLRRAAARLSLDLEVTDPVFDQTNHRALTGFVNGEAKEGVAMGGALRLAAQAGVPMSDVRTRTIDLYESLVTNGS